MEISTAGYQDIRNYVQANWKTIEFLDGAGVSKIKIDTTDTRLTWTNIANAQTLELTIVIKGSDAGITLPLTLAKAQLYKTLADTTPFCTETFTTPFTFESAGDTLTVKYQIQIPKIV